MWHFLRAGECNSLHSSLRKSKSDTCGYQYPESVGSPSYSAHYAQNPGHGTRVEKRRCCNKYENHVQSGTQTRISIILGQAFQPFSNLGSLVQSNYTPFPSLIYVVHLCMWHFNCRDEGNSAYLAWSSDLPGLGKGWLVGSALG